METRLRHVWRWGIVAIALAAVLPDGWSAARRVQLRRDRPGLYRAKDTFELFPGRSAVAALGNRILRAEVEDGYRSFVRQVNRDLREQGRLRLPYEHQTDGTISLARPDLDSAYLTTYEFMGGAHGMTTYTAVNVGLVNGRPRRLTLQDLFRPGVLAAQVAADRVKEHLRANPRAAWFAPGADPSFLPKDADLINQFIITPTGVTFLIQQYVAGPYAVGSFFVKIPFAEFGDKLDPRGPLRNLLAGQGFGSRPAALRTM